MEGTIKDLLLSFSKIDFGAINLTGGEKEFYEEINIEFYSFFTGLPKSTHRDAYRYLIEYFEVPILTKLTQTDAPRNLMEYFEVPFNQRLAIFDSYYEPSWSIIYWLIQSAPQGQKLEQRYAGNVKKAHAMAMFLHPLDDHLNDSQWPVTHIALLLRSQSWMIMNTALNSLLDGIDGGKEIIRSFTDIYYSGICSSEEIASLESYCALFRKQMATWYLVPVIIAKKLSFSEEFTSAIQAAYGSFGIAWKLLDDIQDFESDMTEGAKSSVYTCLPENLKKYWVNPKGRKSGKKTDFDRIILDYIVETSIIDKIKEKICHELETAASIADFYDMTGLSNEFRCLLSPLRNERKLS